MKQDKQAHRVVHQELALDIYLRTLLEEIPSEVGETAPIEQPDAAPKTAVEPVQRAELNPPLLAPTLAAAEIEAGLPVPLESREAITNQQLAVMPDWARHEFQALFFKVDQLTLATPLTDLLRTLRNERQPTKLPGQPSWFLGLLDEHDGRIGVLDTGQLLFGKNKGKQRDPVANPFRHILITGDGRWGLACDEILSISRLQPDKVRWRTLREKRPWLVGTVIEELTAVIDVQQLVPHRKMRH